MLMLMKFKSAFLKSISVHGIPMLVLCYLSVNMYLYPNHKTSMYVNVTYHCVKIPVTYNQQFASEQGCIIAIIFMHVI